MLFDDEFECVGGIGGGYDHEVGVARGERARKTVTVPVASLVFLLHGSMHIVDHDPDPGGGSDLYVVAAGGGVGVN